MSAINVPMLIRPDHYYNKYVIISNGNAHMSVFNVMTKHKFSRAQMREMFLNCNSCGTQWEVSELLSDTKKHRKELRELKEASKIGQVWSFDWGSSTCVDCGRCVEHDSDPEFSDED